jgi:organic hydroperoxide reductase OsmC/OhrA
MRDVAVKAKELRYSVSLAPDGELTDENGIVLDLPAARSPEHLLLAALVRCSLKSLDFHARRRSIDVRSASGSGRTLVTKRETDDRYALVETEVELAVEIQPAAEPDALADLLGLAQRDCFVGSSLTAKPSYRWIVNGRTIDS